MLSILNHSWRIQRDPHLISSSWKYAGRSITRSYFSVKYWLNLFINFHHVHEQLLGWVCNVNTAIFFLDCKRRFHIGKCSIKERALYWSFSVRLECILRNIILIYLLSTKHYYFCHVLVKLTTSAYTDWNRSLAFSHVSS